MERIRGASGRGYLAEKSDGAVVAWGFGEDMPLALSSRLSWDSITVDSKAASAATAADGAVMAWGDADRGGDLGAVAAQLSGGVSLLVAGQRAMCAVKADGLAVTWGSASQGDSSSVASRLAFGVEHVVANVGSMAALKSDGAVVTWGDKQFPSDRTSHVNLQLSSDVGAVVAADRAMAALQRDGSVVAWGQDACCAYSVPASQLNSDVVQLKATSRKRDGAVVAWGHPERGGRPGRIAPKLAGGVRELQPRALAVDRFLAGCPDDLVLVICS